MPARNIRGEELKLLDVFAVDRTYTDDNGTAIYTCKKCSQAWAIVVDAEEKTIGKGEANALLAHARAHDAVPRMRKL